MKTMKNRIISATIAMTALIVAAATAVSCDGGKKPGSTTGSTAVSDTDNDVLKNIPERNFGGYKFKVLSRAGSQYTLDFFDDGTTSEPVNEAVYRRNAYLQDRYGFEVVLYTVDSSDESAHSDELKRSITAQDGQYDLGLIHTIAAGTLAADGDLYNWNDIPVLDFTQPWWSDSIIECLEVGKALYMATNSTSLHSMEYAWGMVFNKDLTADMQVGEDFYGLVRSGEWTIDRLYSVTRKISDDIDGELGMGKNDRYGMGINWWGGTIALMYGMGQKVCERDSDGYPVLNFNTPKMVSIVEKMYNLMYENESCMTPVYMPDVYTAFKESRILLCEIVINELANLRDMGDEFGVLPLPKYDTSQKDYLTMVDGHANMMCIPSYIDNPERHGVILEAMAALSQQMVLPAYYDVTLQNKNSRDEESKEMLDIIMNGRTYDFGYLYDIGGMSFIIYKLMEGHSTNFVSDYMSAEPAAVTQIMNLVSTFEELAKK